MARVQIPFINSTVTHNSITSAGTQKLSNLYAQTIEDPSKSRLVGAVLKGTPGFSLWKNLSGSVVRGMIVPGDGFLYVVKDNTVYKVTTAGVETSLGTINNSTGRISMATSRTEVVICNELKIYKIVLATATLSDISASLTSIDATYVPKFVFAQNSRFYYYVGKDNNVFISDTLDAATVQNTANIQISLNYGTLQWGIDSAWYQYYLAENTVEIWVDQGQAGAVPIVRPDGMSLPIGVIAKYSVQMIDDMLYFLAKDKNGLLGVVQVQGNQFNVVSDYSLLARIREFVSITDAYAYQDNWEGHPIYCITFPNAVATPGMGYNQGYTIAYDTVTKLWTEHPSYNDSLDRIDSHEAYCSAYFNNLNLIGSYKSGKIYSESPLVYTEDGVSITREFITPHILFNGELGTISHLEIEVESNEGLVSGQGSDPQLMISYSKDYGNTYNSETMRSASVLGQFKKRVKLFTLGSARVFTLKVRMTDPIRWVFPAITADVTLNK